MPILWQDWSFYCLLPPSAKRGSPPVLTGVLGGCSKQSCLTLTVNLLFNLDSFQTLALVDSGCEQNCIDANLTKQLNLQLWSLSVPVRVLTLDGKSLSPITKETVEMELVSSGNHRKSISFLVFLSPQSPVILGHPWLANNNNHFAWKIESWSLFCLPYNKSSVRLTGLETAQL